MMPGMPADATQLLNAVKTALEGEFSGVPVYQSKRAAANGRAPLGGWTEGYKLPCFVVSEGEAERIDDYGAFDLVSVSYPILVEYIKAGEAKTSDPQTRPATVAEDPQIREIRAAVRHLLYKPFLVGVANIIDVKETQKGVYETATTGGGKAVVSGQVFAFDMWEERPD